MSKQEVLALPQGKKQEIIDYYLYPHSYRDTSEYFNLSNLRFDLDYILKEANIPHHTKAIYTQLQSNCKTACKYCGKVVRNCNIDKHLTKHETKPEQFNSTKISYKLNHDGLVCRFCGKECKNRNSLCNHERLCKENPNCQSCQRNTFKDYQLKYGSWSKGLTKETDERIAKQAKQLTNRPGTFAGKHHSQESKQKISKALLEYNHADNQRNLHSHGGWYNNIYFMSTWELAYYIYMCDQGKIIKRCDDRFEYIWQDKKHYYTPDFIISDCYIEIKGKEWPKDLEKYKAVRQNNELVVVYYDEIKKYIEYVLTKFNINKIEELYQ